MLRLIGKNKYESMNSTAFAMKPAQSLAQIDQLLDELEVSARSNIPSGRFLPQLLERLRFLLEAEFCLVALPTSGRTWLSIAQSGVASETTAEVLEHLAQRAKGDLSSLRGQHGSKTSFALPIRSQDFSKGCLLVLLDTAPPDSSVVGLLELLAAFAELVALRQMLDLEKFLDNHWSSLQSACSQVGSSKSIEEAAALLANSLVPILNAARVSWSASENGRLAAVSGVPKIAHRSHEVRALESLMKECVKSDQPISKYRRANRSEDGSLLPEVLEDGTFANLVVMPFRSQSSSKLEAVTVVEWSTYEDMVANLPAFNHLQSQLAGTWQQQSRWLKIPALIRLVSRPFSAQRRIPAWLQRLVLWGGVVGLLFFVLNRPYPLTIEAEGVIEPAVARSVFAGVDGVVQEVMPDVDDGKQVSAGQVLARLHAPEIDLQIEEKAGQLRTLAEKKNGIRIAINQLDPSAPEALASQSKLSADILEIERQEENLTAQLVLVKQQQELTEIKSPIDGFVVAKDLKQQLVSRPLKRGDALFRVIDLNGPWQLKVQVADRDSTYVRRYFKPAEKVKFEFVLDSLPDERFPAEVTWVSNSVQNKLGTGCFLELRADVPPDIVERSYMGSNVRAYFVCGQQPTWFVWCRPLVEAIQKRFWVWSDYVDE